jgi:D-beta-D-heptose 7-phosphate kinase/D-beta-D-heptose 1-phosphate adenosyltransferase
VALLNFLNKFTGTKLLVIGDLMLDHYIWGDAHRISPEAPVPVVHVTRDTYTAGGAANVALNLANLGVETTLLGYFSEDEAGSRLSGILGSQGIKLLPSEPIDNAPTIIKTRVLVRNQQLCRIDREAGREIYCINQGEEFFKQLRKVLTDVNAVIISDYAKGVVNQKLLDEIFSAAQTRKIFIAVDPKPSRKLLFRGANLLNPNRSEAMELAGMVAQGHSENYPLAEICRKIDELYAPKLLVITLGADGMAICQEGRVIEILPTEAREVFDVSGAGDTVIATLTAALAAGANPHEAARLANAAAGCVVGHMGTAPIRLPELKSRIQDEG